MAAPPRPAPITAMRGDLDKRLSYFSMHTLYFFQMETRTIVDPKQHDDVQNSAFLCTYR